MSSARQSAILADSAADAEVSRLHRAVDLELELLAIFMIYPGRVGSAVEGGLTEESFADTSLGAAFGAIASLGEAGNDPALLRDELSRRGRKDAPRIVSRLVGTEGTPDVYAIDQLVTRIKEAWAGRRLAAVGAHLAERAKSGVSPSTLIGELRSKLDEVQQLTTLPGELSLKAYPLEELFRLDLPEPEFLLVPLFRERSLVMVYASRGVGKSLFSDTLALGIACGQSCFDRWEAPLSSRVVVIHGEMTTAEIRTRYARLIVGNGFDERLASQNLRILPVDLWPRGLNLLMAEDQRRVESLIDGAKLLILDSESSLFGGPKIDAEDWAPIGEWLLRLKRSGIAVLLIHHAGKGGDQLGTVTRETYLDVILRLRRPDDYTDDEGARFLVEFKKARGLHGRAAEPFEVQLTETPLPPGVEGSAEQHPLKWTSASAENAILTDVVDLAVEGASYRTIAKEVGCSISSVKRRLDRAKEKGLLPADFEPPKKRARGEKK